MKKDIIFDSLQPFKSSLEQFIPHDTLPWIEMAENYLKCEGPNGFPQTRSYDQIDAWVSWINKTIKPRSRILDLGCGPGLYSNRLASLGHSVVGIDISPALINYAETKAGSNKIDAVYKVGSFMDIDYQEEFDFILVFQSTFNSLNIENAINLIDKIYNALKIGGQILFEVVMYCEDDKRPSLSIGELQILKSSPWSDKMHIWEQRDLFFVAERELVNHHLIRIADCEATEYWYRMKLYTVQEITQMLQSWGMKVVRILGPEPDMAFNIHTRLAIFHIVK